MYVEEVKIRQSLTPGTVCILIAGPYKGKRVVMVKKLPSGNIVITGPFKTNGIPLRRANPRYVIATSTKVPIDGIDVSSLNDALFNKEKTSRAPRRKNKNFKDTATEPSKQKIKKSSKTREELQEKIDSKLEAYLNEEENALLKQYLKTRFTLRDKMYPHELKF